MGGPGLDAREADIRESTEHSLSTKELHSQKGKDNDEQEKEEQQADDGFHGVEKRDDQVPERCPVPANRGQGLGGGGSGCARAAAAKPTFPTWWRWPHPGPHPRSHRDAREPQRLTL